MSYNVSHSEYLTDGRLRMTSKVRRRLAKKYEADLPAGCFLTDDAAVVDGEDDIIDKFWWHGEGSGYADEILCKHILPKTAGCADLLFIWEGGDSVTGIQVRNGDVTHCNVGITLMPAHPPKKQPGTTQSLSE